MGIFTYLLGSCINLNNYLRPGRCVILEVFGSCGFSQRSFFCHVRRFPAFPALADTGFFVFKPCGGGNVEIFSKLSISNGLYRVVRNGSLRSYFRKWYCSVKGEIRLEGKSTNCATPSSVLDVRFGQNFREFTDWDGQKRGLSDREFHTEHDGSGPVSVRGRNVPETSFIRKMTGALRVLLRFIVGKLSTEMRKIS